MTDEMINIIVGVETPTYQLDEHTDDIMRLVNLGAPKTLIAKQYGCSVGNLYNFLNRIEHK